MPKYATYAKVLETRIRRGVYAARDLPTEQEFADEVGVSRMTARRALVELMDKGLLVRTPHGRLVINQGDAQVAEQLRLAFLSPAYSSHDFKSWRLAVGRVSAKVNAVVCNIDYVDWHDSIIPRTLSQHDGVFLIPSSESLQVSLCERLRRSKKLVALGTDLSKFGIPSLRLLPPILIRLLADHLYERGHRNIDCLNTQPHDEVIQQRIAEWQLWQRIHKVAGRLIDEPVDPSLPPAPQAYKVITRMLQASELTATAIVCVTGDAAYGAMRALHDQRVAIGRDIAVCAMEFGGMESLSIPSLTTLSPPDPDRYLKVCVDWMAQRDGNWTGLLLMQPADVPISVGESSHALRGGPKN